MNKRFTITNTLILICIIVTYGGQLILGENLYSLLGMHAGYLERGNYTQYIIQIFSSQFLHGSILHIAMNSLFLFYFGNIIEQILGKNRYIIFFIFVSIFIGILLPIFVPDSITMGISGFAMALITYYTMELYMLKNPEYTGGITAIIINIGIGLMPGISLEGHVFGVVAGILFYIFNHRVMSPLILKGENSL